MQPEPQVEQQPVMVGAAGGLQTGQILMIGPPSAAAKVIGILVTIFGGLSILATLVGLVGLMMLDRSVEGTSELFPEDLMGYIWFSMALSIIIYGAIVFGGVQMIRYQKMGIWICLGALGVSMLVSMIGNIMYPELGHTPDVWEPSGAIQASISAVCSLICGLIVAIPLMIANNGLQPQSHSL